MHDSKGYDKDIECSSACIVAMAPNKKYVVICSNTFDELYEGTSKPTLIDRPYGAIISFTQ